MSIFFSRIAMLGLLLSISWVNALASGRKSHSQVYWVSRWKDSDGGARCR